MEFKRLIKPDRASFFLLGARGTGKTTWLNASFPGAFRFDLLDEGLFHNLLREPGLFSETIAREPKNRWIVIDEIQRLPGLLNEVHRAIESDRRKFVLCGSSARKLKAAGVNLLGGRAGKKIMHPLTPFEMGDQFRLERALSYGTIPVIVSASSPREALESYVQVYLKEEVQAEALVRNLSSFVRFLPVAALFHSQVLNISSLARDAGVKRNTVEGYLEILEDTLLSFRLPAYEGKLRVREKTHPKFYFLDPGLVRGLKRSFGDLVLEERGSLFEGFVVQLLRAFNSYHPFFDDIYFWAPIGSKVEVDILLTHGRSVTAIEVKSHSAVRSEYLKGLRAIADLGGIRQRILVYLGSHRRKTEDGIEILPFSDFLEWIEKR